MLFFIFFFFNDTATTEIYTLSLHDALPIYLDVLEKVSIVEMIDRTVVDGTGQVGRIAAARGQHDRDRKSTRLNSSHGYISYAVFCLKKKKSALSTTNIKNAWRSAKIVWLRC